MINQTFAVCLPLLGSTIILHFYLMHCFASLSDNTKNPWYFKCTTFCLDFIRLLKELQNDKNGMKSKQVELTGNYINNRRSWVRLMSHVHHFGHSFGHNSLISRMTSEGVRVASNWFCIGCQKKQQVQGERESMGTNVLTDFGLTVPGGCVGVNWGY